MTHLIRLGLSALCCLILNANVSIAQVDSTIYKQILTSEDQALLSHQLSTDTSLQQHTFGIVNLSVANLRTSPSHTAEMATQLCLGTQVDILQQQKGDYSVRTPEGYIAWVPISSIVSMDQEDIKKWKAEKKIIYTNEFGKSYSQADKTSQRVSDLVYGNILALIAEEHTFYKVRYPDARIAYIPKDEAQPFERWKISRKLNGENLIASAKTMMGLPYLWGGTSVKGVDCSGFTKTAFFMNGYIIPRDASQQARAGETVDITNQQGHFSTEKALKNLRPADLIFFAAGKNSSPDARVTHVAMYIGNGEFIHAAGTVRINSFLAERSNYDDFQARTVVAARRYLSPNDPQIQSISNNTYY